MKTWCFALALLLAWSAPGRAQDETQTEVPRFEVATVGSGAPELFVLFGDMDTPLLSAARSERRAIAEALRTSITPGNGRFHLLIDPGPRDLSAATFRGDFPVMFANPATLRAMALDFEEPFQRQDSRAIASYLVRHIRGTEGQGIRSIVMAQPEASAVAMVKIPGPRSFEAFAAYGLGAELLPGIWPSNQPEVAAQELLKTLDAQRVQLNVMPEGFVHLGGDLYQVDLYLSIDGFSRGKLPNNDERRLFPQDSFRLQLTATQALQAQPVVEGTQEDPSNGLKKVAKAEVIELAFCPPYSEPFTRVSGTLERFVLPQPQGLPAYVLRVILRYPEGVASARLELDAGSWGRAQVELGQRSGTALEETSAPQESTQSASGTETVVPLEEAPVEVKPSTPADSEEPTGQR